MVNTKRKRYRTMIVEDDPMAARHLEMVLDKMEKIFISYVIENALMAEAYCCREHIDLILMDVCTAMNASGLEAAVKIKKNFPAVKILILTSQLDPELLRRAREAKIEGFCYKLSDDSEITAAICAVINGENVYPDEIPVVKIGNAWSTEIDWQHMNVLRELSAGKMDEEIAKTLHLSVYTVKKIYITFKGYDRLSKSHRAGSCGKPSGISNTRILKSTQKSILFLIGIVYTKRTKI